MFHFVFCILYQNIIQPINIQNGDLLVAAVCTLYGMSNNAASCCLMLHHAIEPARYLLSLAYTSHLFHLRCTFFFIVFNGFFSFLLLIYIVSKYSNYLMNLMRYRSKCLDQIIKLCVSNAMVFHVQRREKKRSNSSVAQWLEPRHNFNRLITRKSNTKSAKSG